MGATPCKGTSNSARSITIAILGLDNAGKTTTTRVLEGTSVDSVTPTVGYSQTDVVHKNEKIKLIDLGGGKSFREAWRHYYDDAYGFIYVLDSSETDRLDENHDVLKRLLQDEKVKGKPILILANKQDMPEALDKNEILEDLKIERLANEHRTICRVEVCTAKPTSQKGKNGKVDEAVRHGFDWLIKTVFEHYDVLHKRVEHDIQIRTKAEQNAKLERQERVRKIREEREKEQGEQPEENNDPPSKGFVPISQAVKNAEQNASGKPPEGKSRRLPPVETQKSKSNGNTSFPPVPSPRSSSQTHPQANEDSSDDQQRHRRHSSELNSRRKESPVHRSGSSHLDEGDRPPSSNDESSINRSSTSKKKKVIGVGGRNRLHPDGLPPLAPSSSAARRDDFPRSSGPPAGTPRPQNVVAQWAITSPAIHASSEKLSTIADNEPEEEEKFSPPKPAARRSVSPHPAITNRVTHEEPLNRSKSKPIVNDDNDSEYDQPKRSSRQQRRPTPNDDDDDRPRRSARKSLSKMSDDDDEFGDNSKKSTPVPDPIRRTKKYYDEDDDIQPTPSSGRKSGGGDSSFRSRSRSNAEIDDDLR